MTENHVSRCAAVSDMSQNCSSLDGEAGCTCSMARPRFASATILLCEIDLPRRSMPRARRPARTRWVRVKCEAQMCEWPGGPGRWGLLQQ